VPKAASYALFEAIRIISFRQHKRVVIAFEHQRMAVAQGSFDMGC
jgi:hypothetical protein